MHDGPELEERRREDDGCAPEADVAVQVGLPASVDTAPIASAIPAWLSASFASVAAAACGGGGDGTAHPVAAQPPGTPATAAPTPRGGARVEPIAGAGASRTRIAHTVACSRASPTSRARTRPTATSRSSERRGAVTLRRALDPRPHGGPVSSP